MITLAYLSPLWFAVMNKRVIQHYKGDLTRIQYAPGKREALMKKYADYAAQVRAGQA
jgi:alkane 1-monooxygenase